MQKNPQNTGENRVSFQDKFNKITQLGKLSADKLPDTTVSESSDETDKRDPVAGIETRLLAGFPNLARKWFL